jgi:SNF2 family DNA or RNA helicase
MTTNIFGVGGLFDAIILDESHFLKSADAQRTKAIMGKNGVVHRAKRVWALSGTPAPNNAGELWILLFTFGYTAHSYIKFIKNFCITQDTNHGLKIVGNKPAQLPVLRSILSKIMLRRRKEEVMKELPPIHYTDIVVEPGPVDLDVEQSFFHFAYPIDRRDELKQILDRENNALKAIMATTDETGTANKQLLKALEAMATSVSTLRRYTGIQKVEKTCELIAQELEAGAYEKIVIFAIHRDVIEGTRQRLDKFGAVTLYGGTEPEKRQRNIDKFQNQKKIRVFIGNIQAAGTAITLTAAHNVIFIEQDWVPGNNAQAAMRCHRIGQTKPVFVRFAGLANSIDERVAHVLRRKTKDLTELFDIK